jgi:hypothetical protein
MSASRENGETARPAHVRSASGTSARAYGIGGRAPVVRKPVKKTYGTQHAFRETAYERRRRERREAEGNR